MNKFYEYPMWLQWGVSILLFALVLGAFFLWNEMLGIYGLIAFLLIPFIITVLQFGMTPFFRMIGFYKYYSPMLLAIPGGTHLDVHNGTSFDYFWVMKWKDKGLQAQRKMLLYYLEGLLAIIKELEEEKLSKETVISGVSYFFSERTAKKMGFELKKAPMGLYLNLFLNFFDLMVMYSYTQGKLAVPEVWKAKKAEITATKLLEQKDFIESFYERLSRRNT